MAANSIESALQSLITRVTAAPGIGDTQGNIGQCVGLVEVWIDQLGLPHVWGNAKDLLEYADPCHYRVVPNAPLNFPLPGDIIVWDGTWGGGFGHCGICVSAAVMHFVAFEQNDPIGSPPHEHEYSYDGVIGWLRPEVQS